MDKAMRFIELVFTRMTPKHLTFTMFITMLLNLFCVFLYFFSFTLYKFDGEILDLINKIWTFEIFECLLLFVLAFNFLGWIISTIGVKCKINIDIENMYRLIGSLYRGFGLYISIYMLYWVIQRNSSVAILLNDQLINQVVYYFCIGIVLMNFINLFRLFLYDDQKSEKAFKKKREKEKYIQETIEKYKNAEIIDIEKAVLLLDLYQKTSKLYDEGIRINKYYFEKLKRAEINRKDLESSSEELSDRFENYINKDGGDYLF